MSEEQIDTLQAENPPSINTAEDKPPMPSDSRPDVATPTEPLSDGEATEETNDATKQTADGPPAAAVSEEKLKEKNDDDKKQTEEAPQQITKANDESPALTVTLSGRKRPPYKYDPEKVTLRFLFANRDGLTVTLVCKPADTVGEVKGALLSVWPEDLPNCSGGDRLRLICMGKGILMPDSRTLEDCQVPVFKTHPTPVNVSVRPEVVSVDSEKQPAASSRRRANRPVHQAQMADQGCACIIL